MVNLIIKEGTYKGFHEKYGYLYQLNYSLYFVKGGNFKKVN